jgi:hypothetical protein
MVLIMVIIGIREQISLVGFLGGEKTNALKRMIIMIWGGDHDYW